MTTAFISGRAGVAFINEKSNWKMLRYESPNEWSPCGPDTAELHFRGCNDVQSIENADAAEVSATLCKAVEITKTVDLTLRLLDALLSETTRLAVVEELDKLLCLPEIADEWTKLFWAEPLTVGADLPTALRIANSKGAATAVAHLSLLRDAQPAINATRLSFRQAVLHRAESDRNAQAIQQLCLSRGFFREFAQAARTTTHAFEQVLIRLAQDCAASEQVHDWESFCTEWGKLLSLQMSQGDCSSPPETRQDLNDGKQESERLMVDPVVEKSQSENLEVAEPGSDSDAALLRRVQDGELTAATSLYVRYANRLRNVAIYNTSSGLAREVPADDIVQSVFRTFLRNAAKGVYQLPDRVELWGLLMAMTLTKIRKAAEFHGAIRRDFHKKLTGNDALLSDQSDSWDSWALIDLKMTVDECIAKHTPLQGKMIQMRIDGYQIEEIAKATKRSKRTVERTLQDFRVWLSRRLDDTN